MATPDRSRKRVEEFLDSDIAPFIKDAITRSSYFLNGRTLINPEAQYGEYCKQDKQGADIEPLLQNDIFEVKERKVSKGELLERLARTTFNIPVVGRKTRDALAVKYKDEYNTRMDVEYFSPQEGQFAPQDFYRFIDGLEDFAKGGPMPDRNILQTGLAVLQAMVDEKKQFIALVDEIHTGDQLDERALTTSIIEVISNYLKGVELPDYIPEQEKQHIRAMLDEVKTINTLPDMPEHVNEKMRALNIWREAENIIKPFVPGIKGADYQSVVNDRGNIDANARDELAICEYAYDSCRDLVQQMGAGAGRGSDQGRGTGGRK